jgi:hypothetical protein
MLPHLQTLSNPALIYNPTLSSYTECPVNSSTSEDILKAGYRINSRPVLKGLSVLLSEGNVS